MVRQAHEGFGKPCQLGAGSDADESRSLGRLTSLDCLRGAVIAAMVLVNNPGHPDYVYSQLAHVAWHGMTFADLVAPWFLWIIGVTTTISLARRTEVASRIAVFGHVCRRAVVLYAIGVTLTALPALFPGSGLSMLENIKLMGILQRIAISYVLGSALFLVAGWWERAVVAFLLLAGYWAVLVWIPGPAGGAGAFDVDGNRAQILDLQVLGQLGEATSHSLLTIPAATSTILLGTLAGELVRANSTTTRKLLWMFGDGVGLSVVALLVSQWIPINRRLWTPSFALLTSGMAMMAFGTLYWLLDVLRLRKGTGWLVAYGVNPIFLFVLSEFGRTIVQTKGMMDSTGRWHSFWTIGYESLLSIADPKAASALFASTYVILLGLLAVVMYRKGWIVKI